MSQLPLPLLVLFAACDPKDASDCESGFVRADDGNCYPIVVDSGYAEADADADADADTDTDADADTDTQPQPPPFRVVWDAKEVVLLLPGGLEAVAWGMAETDCKKGQCWTGEDCVHGDKDGGSLLQYCHPVTGAALPLRYGGAAESLDESTETFFRGPQYKDRVTHYVELKDGRCFVTGHEAQYYAQQSCVVF